MTPALRAAVSYALGHEPAELHPLGSGFTTNWRVRAGLSDFFVKVSSDADRLQAEADGLVALTACRELIVPAVIAAGSAGEQSFLILEWLPLTAAGSPAALGEAIAALHDIRGSAHGWHRDNYLGATPQENSSDVDWARFFAHRRLGPQLERATDQGFAAVAAPGQRLLERLPTILAGHRPAPALLHGDLWHGNTGYVAGRPAVFDPAVHFGDVECELAMAALFGGFPGTFFAAHAAHHPLSPGWQNRRRLYQLYHLLNHLNLFGTGYLPAVLGCLEELT